MIFMEQEWTPAMGGSGLGYIVPSNKPEFPLQHTPDGQVTLLGGPRRPGDWHVHGPGLGFNFLDPTPKTLLIVGGLVAAAGMLYFATRSPKPRKRRQVEIYGGRGKSRRVYV